ncbi:MAG TPA: hypothetical protein VJ020_01625, partial [Anaerolineales bacterium]|nr:hypothetical protein [Anaerolineales bacterium]
VSFAGIRWVPVASVTGVSPQTESQVRTLAQQGPDGGQKPATPTTVTTGAAAGPQITNQEVINAFILAGSQFGDSWQNMITAARLAAIYENRKAPYTGPAIAALPNLGTDRKAAIAEALKIPAADLAKAAASASKPAAPVSSKGKLDGHTWGVHGSAGSAAPPRELWDFWVGELKAIGIKWYKQCDSHGPDQTGDGSIFRWVLFLRDHGITPVVRYQMGHQFPNRLDQTHLEKMNLYAREKIVWAEIGNEPNLIHEWQWSAEEMSWQRGQSIPIICEVWLNDAEEALRRGVRPAWYAMAPTDWKGGVNPVFSGPKFQELCWRHIASDSTRKSRAQAIFRNGGWVAVHSAVYEYPVDFDPFNYPDKFAEHGRAPWDMCLRSYEIPIKYIADNIGLTAGKDMPIMSTESGVFTPESHSMDNHIRLESDDAHANLVLKMFDWLDENSPLQAMMPWTLAVCDEIGLNNKDFPADGWYMNQGMGLKARAVVKKMKDAKKQRK